MADPALFGVVPECGYRVLKISCPHLAREATITAATWKTSTFGWTRWTVVDCSLLSLAANAGGEPAGWSSCDRACLAELEREDPEWPLH